MLLFKLIQRVREIAYISLALSRDLQREREGIWGIQGEY